MRSLDLYILRQCLIPLSLMLIVTTLVVWMTQTLQRVEIIVEYGQSLGVFAFLSILIIPSLLAIIIPFTLFGAAIFALYRMQTDSEIAVMFAAGISRSRIAAPILFITILGALVTLYVNIDLMPRTYRILKQAIADIRADLASSIVRSGEFTTLGDGITVYVEEARPGGQFLGLLIKDYRDPESPETYMARKAILRESNSGPVLYLREGNIQQTDDETGEVNFVRFEEWAINVESFGKRSGELQLELTERYLSELLNPDLTQAYDRNNATRLIAEGHSRLAAPIYAFAYVFIGLYALIGGPYSRRSYFLRIVSAGGAVFAIRVSGFVAQGFAERTELYWVLYAIPSTAALFFCIRLLDWPKRQHPTSLDGAQA